MFRKSIYVLDFNATALIFLVFITPSLSFLLAHWSIWSLWSACSGDCSSGTGYGYQRRERHCVPGPLLPCSVPPEYEQRRCVINCANATNVWSRWSSYSSCSTTCGPGNSTSTRQCTTGNDCIGESIRTVACHNHHCISGTWGHWSSYSSCSTTCGIGNITSVRYCATGNDCIGANIRTYQCYNQVCSIDGHWGVWSSYSQCSASCGPGLMFRKRQCDSPVPSNGGLDCYGLHNENKPCLIKACSIDGQWGAWSDYHQCSATCGHGIKFRTRACDNPAPSDGGLNCVGNQTDLQICIAPICPIDGQWGSWSSFRQCSASCGYGVTFRWRQCDRPAPAHGGANCTGNFTDIQTCTNQPCEIDGQWNTWSSYQSCSVTCGHGVKSRTRTCDNPVPTNGGHDCVGNKTDFQNCIIQPCPSVNGAWSSWGVWEACSVTCGGNGTQSRRRTCSNPAPNYGGMNCQGVNEETRLCQQGPCPTFPCYSCDGPVPQLCTHLMKPILCHEPYCINELTNSANGQKILNRRCGTKHECDRDWWYSTSDNEKCTRYDDTRTMYFDIQCTFCCTEAYCNKPTVPTYSSLYRPHGHYTLGGK